MSLCEQCLYMSMWCCCSEVSLVSLCEQCLYMSMWCCCSEVSLVSLCEQCLYMSICGVVAVRCHW